MEIEYTSLEHWHFYINDYLADITNDKSDMLKHLNSKCYFQNFNNYRNLIGEETFKVKYRIIPGNNYSLEKMQSKNQLYFVERLIEISESDITAFDFRGTENSFKK